MLDNLYELAKSAQNGDNDSMLLIISKFTPLLRKYSNKLGYDGALSDLTISLIITVKSLPLYKSEKMTESECITSYIYNSIKHEYIRLSKKYDGIYKSEIELNEKIAGDDSRENIETQVMISALLDKLPPLQNKVITQIYINGYKVSEIADQMNVTRQAVNKVKNRGLENLKKYLMH